MNESEISKIIGLTVDVKMNGSDEVITGLVFTLVKSNSLLVLLKRDENDPLIINSYVVNLNHIKEITVSQSKYDVSDNNII